MSRKLTLLIAAYAAEHATLSTQLAECLEEADYKRAHLFQKGLFRVNQQLHALRCLQNKKYEAQAQAAQRVEGLRHLLAKQELLASQEPIKAMLAKAEAELAELQRLPMPLSTPSDLLLDLLRKLLRQELAGFTLVLSQAARFNCHLRVVRRTLLITIPEILRHRAAYTLEKRHLRHLRRLGFRSYDHGDKQLLLVPFDTIADVPAVRQVLARLVFEVLDYKNLEGQMMVRYWPR